MATRTLQAEQTPLVAASATPFLDHAQAAEQRALSWKRLAWLNGCLALCCFVGAMYFAGRESVYAYVVQITNGQSVSQVGLIPSTFDMGRQPEVVHYYLNIWVGHVRGITTDPVAWQQNWQQAEAFMSQRAMTMTKEFKAQQKSRLDLGKAVMTKVLNLQPLAGTAGRVWEADWTEQAFSPQGYLLKEESGQWHATLKVAQLPPKKLKTPADYANPLRLFVEEVSWQERVKGL